MSSWAVPRRRASGNVNRESFRRFVAPLLERNAGIQALEWIPRVTAEERSSYEARARADGFDGRGRTCPT